MFETLKLSVDRRLSILYKIFIYRHIDIFKLASKMSAKGHVTIFYY